ncbi:hypothetical protein CPSG_01452 [Coccidioides posadasii str. Silveira]|uniref:Uncharacterized protein n=1 Tax=Coccidioides posadasii (strain RMSCC 757 / Silveira) TaxID=443226 RepID=E9CVG9_COCPS|nr:hypothetical protein CPSG_01452 [Coccidioides posadasii str. Silveira]
MTIYSRVRGNHHHPASSLASISIKLPQHYSLLRAMAACGRTGTGVTGGFKRKSVRMTNASFVAGPCDIRAAGPIKSFQEKA